MGIADFTKSSLQELMSLRGRAAVVTGGARGIGFAIARRLSEAGAYILIADIDEGGCLKSSVKKLTTKDREAFGFHLDTRDAGDMERAADEAVERFGRLDIWINDAGIFPSAPLMKLKEDILADVLDTNIKGVFHGARAAAKRMNKSGGVILNLASVAGFKGNGDMTHYCASKFAVRGFTAALAKELGGDNIRVVAVAPTLVDTPGVHQQMSLPRVKMAAAGMKLPLGRVSVPDDIARAALFLVSDLAGFVTGTTLVVDGGDMLLG